MKPLFVFFFLIICTSSRAQLPAYVPSAGIQGWYPFSGSANNANGTGLNGTVSGASLTTDRFGNPNSAYLFDGNTNNITIDTTFFDIGWSDYSISCWFNSDTLDNPINFNKAQALYNTIPHKGIAVYFSWLMSHYYDINVGSYPTASFWDVLDHKHSNMPCVLHTWKHLVIVKANDSFYSVYSDGVLDTMYQSNVVATSALCKMVLGRTDPGIISEGFMGKLDDYGIWKTALSACEVRRLYNASAFIYITLQPVDQTAAAATTTTFSVTDTGIGNTHQWQVNSGAGYVNVPAGAPYSGITTATLTITGVTGAMNNNKYRCIVSRAGGCTDTSGYGKLTVTTVGANQLFANNPILLMPNPTTGAIIVNGLDKADIKIYNGLGQLVKYANGTNNISITDLVPGYYMVKLFDERGALIHYDKVVKQ